MSIPTPSAGAPPPPHFFQHSYAKILCLGTSSYVAPSQRDTEVSPNFPVRVRKMVIGPLLSERATPSTQNAEFTAVGLGPFAFRGMVPQNLVPQNNPND